MFGFLNKKSPADQSSAPKARKGNNGFYMELDDSQKAAQSAAGANNGKPATPAEAVKAVKAEAAPKSKKAKAQTAAQPAKVESAPKPEPVTAAAPTATPAKPAQPAVKNFAPDYLLTLSATEGRRRPGANMSSFLEMARQVKTRG